jgi:hypothetical protein
MKRNLILTLLLFVLGSKIFSQPANWTKEQLMPAKDLADKIQTKSKDLPIIINVGPMDLIKTAISVGRGTSVTGIEKLKSTVAMENKNKTVVVYCGCCSYSSCPNIKPAYDALISSGFKNAKVLDLPVGIREDWVAKGYPME